MPIRIFILIITLVHGLWIPESVARTTNNKKRAVVVPVVVPAPAPVAVGENFVSAELIYSGSQMVAQSGFAIVIRSNWAMVRLEKPLTREHLQQKSLIKLKSKNGESYWGQISDIYWPGQWVLVSLEKKRSFEGLYPSFSEFEKNWNEGTQKVWSTAGVEYEIFKDFFYRFQLRAPSSSKPAVSFVEDKILDSGHRIMEDIESHPKIIQLAKQVELSTPQANVCSTDLKAQRELHNATGSEETRAFMCARTKQGRELVESLEPDIEYKVGVAATSSGIPDKDLLVSAVQAVSKDYVDQLESMMSKKIDLKADCSTNWIKLKNIWTRSCIYRSRPFNNVFDGVHVFGFFKNKKVVYVALYLHSFSESSHKFLINKYADSLHGSLL